MDKEEELVSSAANLSIARQISVSKRQRQLLPIKARKGSIKKAEISFPIGRPVDREETTLLPTVFVNEKRPMTPQVVNGGRDVKSERAELVRPQRKWK
jgi:hypothetical protein